MLDLEPVRDICELKEFSKFDRPSVFNLSSCPRCRDEVGWTWLLFIKPTNLLGSEFKASSSLRYQTCHIY